LGTLVSTTLSALLGSLGLGTLFLASVLFLVVTTSRPFLGSPGLGLGDTGLGLDHFENTSGLDILAEFKKKSS